MGISLEGQTIAVAGAGSGIGAAVARKLSDAGADVAVLDIDPDSAKNVATTIGGRWFEVDVTSEQQVSDACQALGRVNGSVNCAGFNLIKPIVGMSLEDWRRMTAVHLDGAFLNLREASRAILRSSASGSIVNIASINGAFVHRGMAGYAAGKAGVSMLTKTAAVELAAAGIRVNAVSPGVVETELTRPVMADPDVAMRWTHRIPLGRLGQPDDIADVVVFLLAEESRWITGQTILADGGASLRVEPAVTDESMWSPDALATVAKAPVT